MLYLNIELSKDEEKPVVLTTTEVAPLPVTL